MKQRLHFLFLVLFLICYSFSFAANPKREFRATWVTTHYSIDWPKTKAVSAAGITKQQAELTAIMDKLVNSNMNAFTFQVRPMADAFYESSYEPWSNQLTGTRGQDPGYDPLEFAISEAHKRGLELHAWINPYRYEITADSWGSEDPLRKEHADWLLTFSNGTFNGTILDPGLPEARAYTVNVIKEIVEKYDVDGIIFDDYFYPYGGTTNEDAASAAQYKPANQSLEDWRRANVDSLIKDVYDMIQETKPWVRFGMAPSGIWTTVPAAASKYGISLPSGIWGMDAYTTLYCNTLEWIKQGTVDYVAPQIYWSTTASGQDFDVLSQWWSQMASHFSSRLSDGKKVHFFSSNASYKVGDSNYPDFSVKEMGLEVEANRRYDQLGGTGAIFYNTNVFFSQNIHTYLAEVQYSTRALMPIMSWKKSTPLSAPTNLSVQDGMLIWEHADAPRFTIYAFKKGSTLAQALADPANLLGVTNQKAWDITDVVDVNNMTFAVCAYDRYGNEYDAGLYNEGEAEDPSEKPLPQGTVSIENVWTHSVINSDWALSTENNNRSITYYDGNLYLPNKGSSKGEIFIINAATGKKTGVINTTEKGFYLHNIRMTEDGQLLFGNSGSGRSNVIVLSTSLTEGNKVEEGYSPIDGRSDFFYSYGSWNERGFLLALSNTGNITKIPFYQGELLAGQQYANTSLPQGTSAKAIPALDGATCYTSASKVIPARHHIASGDLLETFGAEKPVVTEVSGLAVFALGGHEYMLTPADNTGSFEVFDISRGLSQATKVLNATPTLGNQANETFTVDFAVHVEDSCNAFIYVLAPNNGVAAYKITFTPSSTSDVESVILYEEPRKVLENGQIYIIRDGEKYNVLGIKIS